MVELEGIEPSAGISVRRDRHAAVSPAKDPQASIFSSNRLILLAFCLTRIVYINYDI